MGTVLRFSVPCEQKTEAASGDARSASIADDIAVAQRCLTEFERALSDFKASIRVLPPGDARRKLEIDRLSLMIKIYRAQQMLEDLFDHLGGQPV